jgi:hypothetical protein
MAVYPDEVGVPQPQAEGDVVIDVKVKCDPVMSVSACRNPSIK